MSAVRPCRHHWYDGYDRTGRRLGDSDPGPRFHSWCAVPCRVHVVGFILLASLWSLAFAGFAYAIALKTGNPAAVNSTFLLFFPFLFLTTSYVPSSELSGWLNTVAGFNPVTYLLGGLH